MLDETIEALRATVARQAEENEVLKAGLAAAYTRSFCRAMERDDLSSLDELLDKKGLRFMIDDTRLTDSDGRGFTPLSLALVCESFGSAEALIARGANVNMASEDGSMPLHHAAYDCPEVVPMLLEKGANIEAVDPSSGDRPLHGVSRLHGAQALVAAGADVNSRNNRGQTPFLSACGRGSECVHFFLQQPSLEITAVNNDGNTALHVAAKAFAPHTVIMRLLLTHFEDVNVRNNRGETPLAVLVKQEWASRETAIVLLEAGAEAECSFEARLLHPLRPFLDELYRNPTSSLPPCRRMLRWAMTSPVMAAALPSIRAQAASASAHASLDALPADIDDMKALRLPLFQKDAWERRKHLVVDRAMTIREAEMEQARSQDTVTATHGDK